MNIPVWNVRGLNHPLKQKKVASRIRKLNISLVCLLETRVKLPKMQEIVRVMIMLVMGGFGKILLRLA